MRKYMKQLFLFIISLLYLGVLMVRPVYAAGAEFVISAENASPGDTVTVSIVNNSGIAVTSGQFDLVYDSERFELVGATLFQESAMPFYLEEGRTDKFRISTIPLTPNQAYAEQVIASITFKLKDSADGQATFELVKSKIGYGNIYENVQNLEVSGTTVGVKIMNPEPGEPADQGMEISEKPDPDPPQQPTEDEHLQPSEPKPTESTEPNEPTESSKPTDLNELTKPTEPTEQEQPIVTSQPDGSAKSGDDVTTNQSDNENRETNTTTSEVLKIATDATTQDEIRIISTLAPADTQTTPAQITEQAMSRTVVHTVETVPTIALAVITSAETEEVLQNNTQTMTEQAQTITTKTEPTTSAATEKTTPATVQQIMENSQNTELNSINIEEQKQAKQEQAFELTGDELNINNKLMVGGLAITAISSLGALIFLIIKNNLRLR